MGSTFLRSRAEQMRSGPQEQLVAGTVGVSATLSRVYILVTLRRFDNKPTGMVRNSPLIPCERRLPIMEISEIQEVTFRA